MTSIHPHSRAGMGRRLLLGGLLAGAVGTAMAAAVAGPGGTVEQGKRLVFAAPVIGGETPALVLVPARIDAVDLKAGAITVAGRQVLLHPQKLRILGPGGHPMAGAANLRAGMQVRFALEAELAVGDSADADPARVPSPGEPPSRRIVLIYIDA